MIPCLQAKDCAAFGDSLFRFGRQAGLCFSQIQGGAYNGEQLTALVEELRSLGVHGVGQSSWGPTGFAFAPTDTASKKLLNVARNLDISSALHFAIAKGRNRGAEIVLT